MLSNIFNFYYFLGKTTVRTSQIFQWMTSQSNNKVFQGTIKHFQSSWKSIVLTFNCFVLFWARSGDFTIFHTCWDFQVDHMKNLFNHNREMIDFLTCGKSASYPIRKQLSKWISKFSMRSHCCWSLFNLHSQKFLEFPQVYSNFVAN